MESKSFNKFHMKVGNVAFLNESMEPIKYSRGDRFATNKLVHSLSRTHVFIFHFLVVIIIEGNCTI
jgi:hypothetical protein